MPTTNKGFIFSIDVSLTALAIFVMLFLTINFAVTTTNRELKIVELFELEKNALFISDSIIKNDNEERLFGTAEFDETKHRVKSNELSLQRLREIKQFESSEFFIQKIALKNQILTERILLVPPTGNCIAIERMVLIEGQKNILEVGVCAK